LKMFFDEGEEPVWEVRGLSSNELNRAIEAKNRHGSIETILKAISNNADQASAIRKAIGIAQDTPGEIAKRLEMLTMGSVTPAIELPVAVKLAESFPIEFLTLTNEIISLTGQGFDIVKPAAASQPTQDSVPA
jgi:hypothetical protein